jgi:hypothetical protein
MARRLSSGDQIGGDFDKGTGNGAKDSLTVIGLIAATMAGGSEAVSSCERDIFPSLVGLAM